MTDKTILRREYHIYRTLTLKAYKLRETRVWGFLANYHKTPPKWYSLHLYVPKWHLALWWEKERRMQP